MMAQKYGFTKENKGQVDAALDFPRLKAEKKGEKFRLAIFSIEDGKLALPEPEGGYYFSLEVPGKERGYVGSFECLADEATKQEGGYDSDACPHCAFVLAGNVSEDVLGKRVRRFVLPVIRYKTQPNSSDLVVPHSVEALAWKFTDRYFNVLVDEHTKWLDSGGLTGHDVTLTCEGTQFQNFTISIEPNAAYQVDRDLGKLVLETYVNQTAALPEGLKRQLGSTINAVDMEKKIRDTIEEAAQLGIGGPTSETVPTVDPATIENLANDLLGGGGTVIETPPTAVAAEPAVVPEVAAAEAVGGASGPTEENAAEPAAAAVDFDSFFETT